MSTQEKLQGLGVKVPALYAGGDCNAFEGSGTAGGTTGPVPHKEQVLLQLFLGSTASSQYWKYKLRLQVTGRTHLR